MTGPAVVQPIVSQRCQPVPLRVEGGSGRKKTFDKEPFIRAPAPQLVLIESKEGHLRDRETEKNTKCTSVRQRNPPQNKQTFNEVPL